MGEHVCHTNRQTKRTAQEYEDKLSMRLLCDNLNKRHLMAQLAGRASVALHTGLFFKVRFGGLLACWLAACAWRGGSLVWNVACLCAGQGGA